MVKTVITRVILQITNILDGRTQVDVSSIVQDLGAQSGVESIKCVLRLRQKAPPFNGYVASITWASSRQLSAAFPKAQACSTPWRDRRLSLELLDDRCGYQAP